MCMLSVSNLGSSSGGCACRQAVCELPSRCRPEQRGTCWQECECAGAGGCHFQDSCAEFTCDSLQLRRKGGSSECVQDECTSVRLPLTASLALLMQAGCLLPLRRVQCHPERPSMQLTGGVLTTTAVSTPPLFSCLQDEWEETEAHSCLKQCNCPSDGSACSQSSSCKRENFSCKQGYKRFSNGDAKCYPIGCQSGALQVSIAPCWALHLCT